MLLLGLSVRHLGIYVFDSSVAASDPVASLETVGFPWIVERLWAIFVLWGRSGDLRSACFGDGSIYVGDLRVPVRDLDVSDLGAPVWGFRWRSPAFRELSWSFHVRQLGFRK